MTRVTRWMLLLCFIIAAFVMTWDLTPRSAGSNASKSSGSSTRLAQKAGKNQGGGTRIDKRSEDKSVETKKPVVKIATSDDDDNDDPDLPPGMAGKVDKEAYLRARGDYFDLLRGRDGEVPEGARERAIEQMERQEKQLRARPSASSVRAAVNTTDWAFIGPNPIPLGQTQGTRVPVSGRTISIAVHPTDPDTVYVGTAQGGLYKSTNGGTNWTKLFEFQLETLAIGAITIDPIDSSIVYVGTGENGQSADSFAGKGLYIIRNANSATPTLNGPFRTNGIGDNVSTAAPLDAFSSIHLTTTQSSFVRRMERAATQIRPLCCSRARGVYRSTNARLPARPSNSSRLQAFLVPIAAPSTSK